MVFIHGQSVVERTLRGSTRVLDIAGAPVGFLSRASCIVCLSTRSKTRPLDRRQTVHTQFKPLSAARRFFGQVIYVRVAAFRLTGLGNMCVTPQTRRHTGV